MVSGFIKPFPGLSKTDAYCVSFYTIAFEKEVIVASFSFYMFVSGQVGTSAVLLPACFWDGYYCFAQVGGHGHAGVI